MINQGHFRVKPPLSRSPLFALKSEERRGELDSSSLFSL